MSSKAGGRVILTAGSVRSRSARKRGSGHVCCSCNTGCTGHSQSTLYISNASPWYHAFYSCHRWCWNGAHLETWIRWQKKTKVSDRQVFCVICDHKSAQTWKTAWLTNEGLTQVLLFSNLIGKQFKGIVAVVVVVGWQPNDKHNRHALVVFNLHT